MRPSHSLLLLWIFFSSQVAFSAWNGAVPESESYYRESAKLVGRKITRVVFLNEKNTPDFVKQHVLSAYMQVFRPTLIREILHWFHDNQIDTRIEIYLEATSANSLSMYVGYREHTKIGKISFDGNVSVSSNLLGTQIELKEGMDYDPLRTDETVQRIINFYNQQGYLGVSVKAQLKDNGELMFHITEGAPTLIDSINFPEIKSVEDKRLRKRFTEQLHSEFGLQPGDKIEREKVQAGILNIKNWLRDHDFLTAKDPTVSYGITEQGRVKIQISIDYGSRIRFGFRGNKQFSYRELIDFVGEVKEVTSGGDYLESVRRRIIEAYKEIGLVNIAINTLVHEDPEKGIRFVSLIISEGEKVHIANLKIEGIYSMDPDEAVKKFESLANRLVQRHFFQESGVNKTADLFANYLKSQGYLSAKLEFAKFDFSKDRKRVDVTLLFNEGIQTFIQDVKINGVKSLQHDDVMQMLGLKEGDPFNIFKFEQGLVALKDKYQELGNLNAQIVNEGSGSIVRYNRDNSTASIQIDVEEGPLIHVGEILVRGNQQTHARVVLRELPFITGDVLTKPLQNEAEENLRKLNLFASVIVRAIDHPGDETKKDILILVEESVPGSFEIAPGYRNDLGLRLGLGSAYQNLGGWNRSVSANAVFNRRTKDYHFPEYDINLGFREPYLANMPVIFTTNLDFLRREYSKFDAYISKLTTTARREITKNFSAFLEYSYEQDNIQNAQAPYQPSDDRQSFIGALTPGFIYDSRNDTFNPSRGFYSINRFELASKYFGSQRDIGYYRTTTSNTKYFPIFGDVVFASTASFGFERSNIANSSIPTFKLFRLGGISSLRGYDDDSIEVETKTTVNGTLGLMNYRGEFRIPLVGAFGTALFFDAGNLMVDHFVPFDVRSSAGVGLRYVTPVGPVALDFAWKLQTDTTVGDTSLVPGSRYKIHFAIGTF